MRITRQSIMSGDINTMDLPITLDQYDAWVNGALVQNVMPHLSAGEREFLISGMTLAEQEVFYEM